MNFTRYPTRRIQIPLYIAGWILVLSGMFHIIVWMIDGGPWEGDVSWRKPILFGLSTGATMLSLGWLTGKLRPRSGDNLLFILFSLAMVFEVALITLQTWRGVPSHFNRSTSYDASVLFGIEALILFATLVIAELTRRNLTELTTPAEHLVAIERDMKLAIRGGMVLLLFACLLGFVIVAHGNQQIVSHQPPGIYGKAGVTKFPHGVPIHAIQFLPIFAWCMRKTGCPERQRTRSVGWAIASIALLTVFSIAQTLGGRARFDLTWISSAVLALSAFAMASAVWQATRSMPA